MELKKIEFSEGIEENLIISKCILLYRIQNNLRYCCHYGDRRELYSTKIYYSLAHWSLVEESGVK